MCTTDCSNLQVTAGLLQLNADAGKSSIWHSGQGSVSDGLALAIARHFKTTEERRNVIEKVKLAGMLSNSNLSTLPSCPVLCAPPLSPLPSLLSFLLRPVPIVGARIGNVTRLAYISWRAEESKVVCLAV